MELFLAPQAASITGSFGAKCGYAVQRQNNRFFAKRNSKGIVPPDGHWRFMIQCANIVQAKIYFADFDIPAKELEQALDEAGICYAPRDLFAQKLYHAQDILNLAKSLNYCK